MRGTGAQGAWAALHPDADALEARSPEMLAYLPVSLETQLASLKSVPIQRAGLGWAPGDVRAFGKQL
jgi:hypothetical protein